MHIKIDLKIFAFIILFCFTRQVEIYVLLMIFAILHEFGHLIAGLLLKLKPKHIEINPFGLAITFEGYGNEFKKNIEKKKIAIALAGPFVNLLFVVFGILMPIGTVKEAVVYLNLLLLLLNLIPIYPLDGGRILKNILHIKIGYWEAYSLTNKISNVLVVILIVLSSLSIFYFQNIAILFIILYIIILTLTENKKFKLVKRAYNFISPLEKTLY